MTTEQNKTLAALQMAIQMEIDGKEFYLKASGDSSNDLGRKLLQKLAAEEDIHQQKFREIYQAIQSKNTWPTTDFQPQGGKELRTVFAQAAEQMGRDIKAAESELEAVQTAIGMENKTYDYYQQQGSQASYPAEQEFYQTLAGEEKGHSLFLLDYFEFLKNPAGWFVEKEHPSLDGG